MRTARRGLSALGVVFVTAGLASFTTGCTVKTVQNNEVGGQSGTEDPGTAGTSAAGSSANGGSQAGGSGGSASGSAGAAGSSAGAGGSSAGAGGSSGGSGGSTAGAGGNAAGAAGSNAGAGGSAAGAGGSSAGAGGSSAGAGGAGTDVLPSKGTFSAAVDCADAEKRLKDDLRARSHARIDAQIAYYKKYSDKPISPSSPEAAVEPNYNRTNNQVAGVDEADIVKTDDDKRLYFLHDQLFTIFQAIPAASTKLLGSISIEGRGLEMYVEGTHAVVFSALDADAGQAVFDAAKVTPRPVQNDDSGVPAPTTELVKITVLDISADTPKAISERYVEGAYRTARRAQENVRVVVNGAEHGPLLDLAPSFSGSDAVADLEALRAANDAKIDASKLADYLPYRFEKKGSVITASNAACEDFYVPTAGSTAIGTTLIDSFDWNTPDIVNPAYLRANATTVYANENQVVVAATAWADDDTSSLYDYDTAPPDGTVFHLEATHVHRFDFAETKPVYVGSVTLDGHLPSQFALDIEGDSLRAATTEWVFEFQGGALGIKRTNHLYTLTAGGTSLAGVGSIHDFGLGESIRSARFVGDRGYIVTFLNTDPLFVFDLKTPAKPTILGELKITGFSEYIHPIDDGHLLTIGREATETGTVLGLAVQIFDVTDPNNPKLTSKSVFEGDDYAFSDAEVDHKAFSYDAVSKTLAFPVTHGGAGDYHSTLQVYDIDIVKGVSRRGSVNHDTFFSSPKWSTCAPYLSSSIKRGVFLGGNLYAVSNAAITAHSATLQSIAAVGLQDATVLGFTCAP